LKFMLQNLIKILKLSEVIINSKREERDHHLVDLCKQFNQKIKLI